MFPPAPRCPRPGLRRKAARVHESVWHLTPPVHASLPWACSKPRPLGPAAAVSRRLRGTARPVRVGAGAPRGVGLFIGEDHRPPRREAAPSPATSWPRPSPSPASGTRCAWPTTPQAGAACRHLPDGTRNGGSLAYGAELSAHLGVVQGRRRSRQGVEGASKPPRLASPGAAAVPGAPVQMPFLGPRTELVEQAQRRQGRPLRPWLSAYHRHHRCAPWSRWPYRSAYCCQSAIVGATDRPCTQARIRRLQLIRPVGAVERARHHRIEQHQRLQ